MQNLDTVALAWTYGKGRQGRQLTSLGVGLEVVSVSVSNDRLELELYLSKNIKGGKEKWGEKEKFY